MTSFHSRHCRPLLAGHAALFLFVFTLASALHAATFTVTSIGNSGPGSLRQAVIDAAATPGADTIVFDLWNVSHPTFTLTSEIVVTATDGVTVDASALPHGATISGGGTTRLFRVSQDAILTLRGLTLTGGNGTGADLSGYGGAVFNDRGALTLTQCLLTGNTGATRGGAIASHTPTGNATLKTTLTGCTVSGNSASNIGGGIYNNNGTTNLTHCTITGNTAPAVQGGGVASVGDTGSHATATVVQFCIIAGNTGGDVDFVVSGSNSFTSLGRNIIGNGNVTANFNVDGDLTGTDPLLDALADNGGPSKTHALQITSPARNAAVGSIITTDQRAFAVQGTPDIGAFEWLAGTFTLSASSYVTPEGLPATITIKRLPGYSGAATVRLFTTPGTATAADFTGRPNSAASEVAFANGEDAKTVEIPTTPDALVEASQSFTMTLGTPLPTVSAALGTLFTATVTIKDPIVVTNLNDDGPGSLRQALRTAEASAGPDIITFKSTLNGQTLVLGADLLVTDLAGVTVDASALAAGLTIDGGPGTNRLFTVETNAILSLRKLALTGGNGTSTGALSYLDGSGGAILNLGTVTLTECSLSGNTAAIHGGAIYNRFEAVALTLTRCTLSGNTAGSQGGAIACARGTLTMTQCTISGNSANYGGGIYNEAVDDTPMTLTHCTVTGNAGGGSVGGIWRYNGPATLNRCIVAGNTSTGAPGAADYINAGNGSKITFEGRSIVPFFQNNSIFINAGNRITSDPLLAPLAADGGFTQTHALLPGSPAIDGAGPHGEVQQVVTYGNGTFDLYFGQYTPTLNSGATADAVRDALNALLTIGGVGGAVAVTLDQGGGINTYTITFLGSLAATNVAQTFGSITTGMTLIENTTVADFFTTDSPVTSDQRGLPLWKVADIGAYEAQEEAQEIPTRFVIDSTTTPADYLVNEGSSATVTIRRTGPSGGTASVRLFTSNGTASGTGNLDFTARPNDNSSVVDFADGETVQTRTIATTGDVPIEANETFTVSLGSPSAGTSLGAPSTATVVIVDPSALVTTPVTGDTVNPTLAVSAPAVGALVSLDTGGTMTVSGAATDNKGVKQVNIFLNGAGPFQATLAKSGQKSTAFSHSLGGTLTGQNTVEMQSVDFAGRTSAAVTRTFKVLRPLLVNVSGNGLVTPGGFVQKSHREVGRAYTLTAKAGTGALFAGWSVLSGHTNTQLGTNAAALEKNTITFIHREGLALRANFVANPYVASTIGTFNGAIAPSVTLPDRYPVGVLDYGVDGTDSGLSTEGYISVTVQGTGAFSGALKMDGMTLKVAGTFDHLGVARFGTSRAKTLSVVRPNKASLAVSLNIDLAARKITGVISQIEGITVVAVSNVKADRAAFSTTNPVPTNPYLAANGASGFYTVFFETGDLGALTADQAPLGRGYGTVTLTKTGTITVAGKLADNTAVTMSTTLSQTGTWRLFAQLYTGLQGVLAGDAVFNHASTTEDLTSNAFWVCPVLDREHYPLGWAEGIGLNLYGSKYTVTPNQSVVPLTQGLGTVDGNATLTLSDGQLAASVVRNVDISGTNTTTDTVAEVPVDPGYSLKITRTTGAFSGTFTHADGTKPAFKGVIFQKNNTGGRGFFLSTQPKPKSYLGQSGSVRLIPR